MNLTGVVLRPGEIVDIEVKDSKGNVLYKQDAVTKEVAENFLKQYGQSTNGYGMAASFFVPLKLSVADCLFPTLFNFALKVENLALRILGGLGALFLDLLTLIPRLIIGAPYRYLHNEEKPHPITALIKDVPGFVSIHLHKEITKIDREYGSIEKKDEVYNVATKVEYITKKSSSYTSKLESYMHLDGAWKFTGSGEGGGGSQSTTSF
jgi:hypothetical protein